MAFTSTTASRGRRRIGSSSTSSLSSLGSPPATDGFYSLAQPQYDHQHIQHPHQLGIPYNPPIDPQLFGITGHTTLPGASFASSNVIAGEVVAGGAASGAYSDTERLPSLGISVSGDEEDDERREVGEAVNAIKLEEAGNEQQHFGTGVDSISGTAGIIERVQSWASGELREGGEGVEEVEVVEEEEEDEEAEEEESLLANRQLHMESTAELSEPEGAGHSDTDLDAEDREETASVTPLRDPTPPPPPPPLPIKRGRGRPRKHPRPVDVNNSPIPTPKPKKTVTPSTPVEEVSIAKPSPAQRLTKQSKRDVSATPLKPQNNDEEFITPLPIRRGPGRPKGSGVKSKGKSHKKRVPVVVSTPRSIPAGPSKTNSTPTGSLTPAQPTPNNMMTPNGIVKRGPGRPRKSILPIVHDAENEEGGSAPWVDGQMDTPLTENTFTPSQITYTPGWRRSARERKSVVIGPTVALAEEDLKAPVMGQGCLKKKRRSLNFSGARTGGAGSGAEDNYEEELGAERRGYIKKAELDKIRRAKITTKLQPPFSDEEPLPTFPPEYGLKVSRFRGRSQSPPPSSAAAANTSPPPIPLPPPVAATSSSLPTPPFENSEDENYQPPRKKAKVWTGETDEGYEPITCVYTFAPTAEVFQDFASFVKTVSAVGKRQGCVRVRLPKECIPEPNHDLTPDIFTNLGEVDSLVHRPPQQLAAEQPPQSKPRENPSSQRRCMRGRDDDDADEEDEYSGSTSTEPYEYGYFPGDDPNLLLNTHQYLSLNARCTTYNPIYDVTTNRIPAISAKDFLLRRDWRDSTAQNSPEELQKSEADDEKILIARGLASLEEENDLDRITYSTDNEATKELRSLFSLSDLGLSGLSGNSLFKSEQQVAGIHTPYFYFASPASVFAMHMEDYAALSINFHHWGAPKRWIICCPADSEKLENLVAGMLGLKHVTCDQFIRHASVFIPTWVLERAGIRYTMVLQEPGDMVLTFPWAYHEGWNQGLNVAEAIGYGDVSWERWVRGYRICGKRCPMKPIEMIFPREGFGEGDGDEERAEVEADEEARRQEERGEQKEGEERAGAERERNEEERGGGLQEDPIPDIIDDGNTTTTHIHHPGGEETHDARDDHGADELPHTNFISSGDRMEQHMHRSTYTHKSSSSFSTLTSEDDDGSVRPPSLSPPPPSPTRIPNRESLEHNNNNEDVDTEMEEAD